MVTKSRLACLVACVGLAGVAAAAPDGGISPADEMPPVDGVVPEGVAYRLPRAAYVDDLDALELANKLGLTAPRDLSLRGLPACPSILTDGANCHVANLGQGATFSGMAPGAFRVMDNVTPVQSNPTRLCWIGRYANRVDPPVADESFQIRIFNSVGGLPDLGAGPIFTRTFQQSGVAGTDLLEMSCLDGETCPGTTQPAAGGHWVFSVEVTGGLPMNGGGCYWVEIANIASNAAGVNWGWVASQAGTDILSLQAIDGNYTTFSRVANDRALCLSGGVDPFVGTCTLPPLPPVCSNASANGIPFDGTSTTGGRASWTGSVGRPSGTGAWTPFQRADGFTFASASAVTNICFGGFWLGVNDAGTTVAVTPPTDPQFRVAYFANLANQGFPGDPLPVAEFAVGQPGVTMVWDGDDITSVTHPAVNFEANECYWVSVGRVNTQQAVGQPVNPLWHWQLTTASGVPTGDNRTATRTVGTGAPQAWGVTIFRGAAPACSPTISNYWFLLDAGPTTAAGCTADACPLTVPPGATANPEPNCAVPSNLNGGCNLATPVFTTLACGETAEGSSSNVLTSTCGQTRDTDWFHLTVAQETEVTVTVNSQFPGFMGFGGLNAGITNPTGSCTEYSGVIVNATPIGICGAATMTRTLAAGTWIVFVAPNFGDIITCDNANNRYTISVSCTGGTVDCNGNGTPDNQEIAANPALDCYNPTVVQNPHVIGGPDGALDACQCQGNFNRDAGVNSTDISAMLTSWLAAVQAGNANADINCSGSTNSTDISAFLTIWLAQVNNQVPFDGCP